MGNLFYDLILFFCEVTGVSNVIYMDTSFFLGITFLMAFLSCFLGFKVYRVFFSILLFIIAIVGITLLLRNVTNWGAVVTTFSIVGLILAFAAFSWKKLGAFIVSGFLSCCFAFSFGIPIEVALIIGLIYAIVSLRMPVEAIIVSSSLWGSRLFVFSLADYLNKSASFNLSLMVIVFITGVLIQYLTNRNQSLLIDEKWEIIRRLQKV